MYQFVHSNTEHCARYKTGEKSIKWNSMNSLYLPLQKCYSGEVENVVGERLNFSSGIRVSYLGSDIWGGQTDSRNQRRVRKYMWPKQRSRYSWYLCFKNVLSELAKDLY